MTATQQAGGLGRHQSRSATTGNQAPLQRNLSSGLRISPQVSADRSRRVKRKPGQLSATSWAHSLAQEVPTRFPFLSPLGMSIIRAAFEAMAHESLATMDFGVTQLMRLPGVTASADTVLRVMRRLVDACPEVAQVLEVGSRGRHRQTVWRLSAAQTRFQVVSKGLRRRAEKPQFASLRLPVGKKGLRPYGPLTPATEPPGSPSGVEGRRGNSGPLTEVEEEILQDMRAVGCWPGTARTFIRTAKERPGGIEKLRNTVQEILAHLASHPDIRRPGAFMAHALVRGSRAAKWMHRIRRRDEKRRHRPATPAPHASTQAPHERPWDIFGPPGLTAADLLTAATAEAERILPDLPPWAEREISTEVGDISRESWYWRRAWLTGVSRSAYLAGRPFLFSRAAQLCVCAASEGLEGQGGRGAGGQGGKCTPIPGQNSPLDARKQHAEPVVYRRLNKRQ